MARFTARWSALGSPTEPGVYKVEGRSVRVTALDLAQLGPILADDPLIDFIETRPGSREFIVGMAH